MKTSRLRRLAARARQIWDETQYVQQRLFELQTGIPVTGAPRRIDRGLSTRPYRRDY